MLVPFLLNSGKVSNQLISNALDKHISDQFHFSFGYVVSHSNSKFGCSERDSNKSLFGFLLIHSIVRFFISNNIIPIPIFIGKSI